jgi:hypothetical protein
MEKFTEREGGGDFHDCVDRAGFRLSGGMPMGRASFVLLYAWLFSCDGSIAHDWHRFKPDNLSFYLPHRMIQPLLPDDAQSGNWQDEQDSRD